MERVIDEEWFETPKLTVKLELVQVIHKPSADWVLPVVDYQILINDMYVDNGEWIARDSVVIKKGLKPVFAGMEFERAKINCFMAMIHLIVGDFAVED